MLPKGCLDPSQPTQAARLKTLTAHLLIDVLPPKRLSPVKNFVGKAGTQ